MAEVNALQGMAAIGQRPLLLEVSELFGGMFSNGVFFDRLPSSLGNFL